MARPLRIQRAGAWYHITARGNERKSIYRSQKDYGHFCELLGEAVERFGWRLHAYVLMSNHYHLLLETPEPNLSASMQWLSVSYTVWFNWRYHRSGHLFQGRFKAIVVDPVAWGLALSRYVHLNPVRLARLGQDKTSRQTARSPAASKPSGAMVQERLAKLRAFGWSSYRAYAGLAKAPKWLHTQKVLQLIGGARLNQQTQAYQRYVEQALREGWEESPWEQLRGGLVLGAGQFLRRMREIAVGNRREQPSLKRMAARPEWPAVVKAVERSKGQKWEEFVNVHGDWGRDLALYLGRSRCQLKLGELGRLIGGMDYAAVATAVVRLRRKLKRDKAFAKLAEKLEAELMKES